MLAPPTVADVQQHGGWLIEDPKSRHDANPTAFWLPDDRLLAAVGPGSQVRLLLWFLDEAGSGEAVPQCERMWALVEARDGSVVSGRLTSPPVSARAPLEMGSIVEFSPKDVIDVIAAEDDWRDHLGFLKALLAGDEAFEEWKRLHPADPNSEPEPQ